jgi:hypothetical protein
MFPDAYDGPTVASHSRGYCLVSIAVALQLETPIRHVSPGRRGVLRTGMPEAAVDKYGDLPTGEHDVRRQRQLARLHRAADAIPQPKSMQLGA